MDISANNNKQNYQYIMPHRHVPVEEKKPDHKLAESKW